VGFEDRLRAQAFRLFAAALAALLLLFCHP
jgi:hypothetical protein